MDVDFFCYCKHTLSWCSLLRILWLKIFIWKESAMPFFQWCGSLVWFTFLLVCVQEVQSMYNIFILSFFLPFILLRKWTRRKKENIFISLRLFLLLLAMLLFSLILQHLKQALYVYFCVQYMKIHACIFFLVTKYHHVIQADFSFAYFLDSFRKKPFFL